MGCAPQLLLKPVLLIVRKEKPLVVFQNEDGKILKLTELTDGKLRVIKTEKRSPFWD